MAGVACIWRNQPFTLRGRRSTWGHRSSLCLAKRDAYSTGLALVARLGPVCRRGRPGRLWQAWHLAKSTFVFRGKRGTCGTGLALALCHTPSLTHIFVTQLCHTHLCRTPSLTHIIVTHTPSLTHIIVTHTHHL